MTNLGKPVRTWHKKYYADTTCTRYDITTSRYCNDPTHQDYQDCDVVDGMQMVNTIPIEWIEEEIRRCDDIADKAIPKIQKHYLDRVKYWKELISNWKFYGHYEEKENETR